MTKITYEKTECSRCGGCGHYSYNQMTGSICFKCNGSGKQLTRKGKAALKAITQFFDDNYRVAVEDLVTGCQIRDTDNAWRTVERVEFEGGGRSKTGNGPWVISHAIVTPKVTLCCRPGATYVVRPTKEQFNDELVPFARRYSGAIITGAE